MGSCPLEQKSNAVAQRCHIVPTGTTRKCCRQAECDPIGRGWTQRSAGDLQQRESGVAGEIEQWPRPDAEYDARERGKHGERDEFGVI